MRKVSKKVISCFMLCALMMSIIMGFAINSNAADLDGSKSQRDDGTYVYYVGTPSSLRKAVKGANDGDCIEFTRDIVYSGTLYVSKKIKIDFNLNSLKFINTLNGLYINVGKGKGITLKNGTIYGANDSNSAVYVNESKVNLKCMEIYGGDCKRTDYYWGNGIYVDYESSIYMNDCFVMGGNGYKSKNDGHYRTAGAAISYKYGVTSDGKGYAQKDGVCKPDEE